MVAGQLTGGVLRRHVLEVLFLGFRENCVCVGETSLVNEFIPSSPYNLAMNVASCSSYCSSFVVSCYEISMKEES